MRGPRDWDEAANGCKILRRRRGIQPPFPLMSKEKAAGGEKETSKGGFASEQTPHSSSCPPLVAYRPRPFRCSSFSHTNRFAGFAWEPCPFANPLKTTKKGAAAPFLGFSPGLGLCGICFQIYKTCYRCVLLNWRGSRNTLRLFRMYLAWKSVCARYAMQPLQEGRPFDFHTSNIQRAQTKRLARYIVRLGNPIRRPPEGRSDYGLCNDKTQNGTTSLSGATALFGVQRSFLPYLFCQDRKDMARGAAVTALRIEPRPRRIRNGPAEQNPCLRRKAHLCC